MNFKTKKTNELVADYIQSLIENSTYKPGDRLPSLKETAETLQVSVGTVREAISVLKTKGLIEIRQGEGTFVRKIELDEVKNLINIALLHRNDLKELIEFRKVLEIGAIQLAVFNRSDEDLLEMFDALQELNCSHDIEFATADYRFHQAIVTASGNSLLFSIFQGISPALQSMMQQYGSVFESKENEGVHTLIYEAIKQQDAPLAIKTMEKHMDLLFALASNVTTSLQE